MTKLFFAVCFFALALPALASVNASYTYVEPTSSDPGQELIRREAELNAAHTVYKTSDNKSSYALGVSLLDTRLDFDEALLNKVELLKVKLPVSGEHSFNERHSLSWSVVPGMHGEKDSFSDAKFRLEGQAMAVYGSGKVKGLYGAGFGDQFGKLQPYPLFGATWQASQKSNLTVMFPLLKYEYTTEQQHKYNFRIQPVGAQWTWQPEDVNTNDPGNILVKGTLFAVGGEFKLNEQFRAFTTMGLVVNRRFEVVNQNDTSRHASVTLKNAWSFQAGVLF
jgi:hypothetical protein